MNTMTSRLAAGIALVSMLTATIPASAQMVPGRAASQPTAMTPSTTTPSLMPSAAANGRDPGYVMLADFVPDGGTPRAARPSTVAEDTPVMSRAEFLRRYPNMGEAGYNRIATSNRNLCDRGGEFMSMVLQFDQQFQTSDQEYAELQQIYNNLPGDVKRATALMTIAQASSTGALCALSMGLYCIAAAAGGIGNIFVSQASKKLQLANIKLTLANIRLTRLNIASNRLTLRLDAFWLDLVVPYCQKIFPGADASAAGSYSSQLSPLPSINGRR